MSPAPPAAGASPHDHMDPELRELFHRLNNQLGIILAHAELIEAKALDEQQRARASQVIASALEAMSVAREIRERGDQEIAGV